MYWVPLENGEERKEEYMNTFNWDRFNEATLHVKFPLLNLSNDDID